MSTIMAFLAKHWVFGYTFITVVCISVYLGYSIWLVKSCRKVGYDVGALGMVPVINLFIHIKKVLKVKKDKKALLEQEIIL